MHISTYEDKTANNLATADLDNDNYHTAIKEAAKVVVADVRGNGNQWVYVGQFSSGSTIWRYGKYRLIVDIEGNMYNYPFISYLSRRLHEAVAPGQGSKNCDGR